ncbi:MAG: class I SAM-dependent methyltransferase [Micromonosporaceae bacterium]
MPAELPGRSSATPSSKSGEHYFTATPGSSARRRTVSFSAAGVPLTLAASSGVFSADRLDPGTAVLLRKAPLPNGPGRYLDLGAGYGPIACALAVAAPQATVYAVDVNTRGLELVRENARTLQLDDRVVAATPDQVPETLTFHQIWSNPPIRIGKPALRQMLDQWLPRLTPDGVAWLVVARHLGADSLGEWLTDRGWRVERHASQKGYRVLAVRNEPPAA